MFIIISIIFILIFIIFIIIRIAHMSFHQSLQIPHMNELKRSAAGRSLEPCVHPKRFLWVIGGLQTPFLCVDRLYKGFLCVDHSRRFLWVDHPENGEQVRMFSGSFRDVLRMF